MEMINPGRKRAHTTTHYFGCICIFGFYIRPEAILYTSSVATEVQKTVRCHFLKYRLKNVNTDIFFSMYAENYSILIEYRFSAHYGCFGAFFQFYKKKKHGDTLESNKLNMAPPTGDGTL